MSNAISPDAIERIESLVEYVETDWANAYLRADFGQIDAVLAMRIQVATSFNLEGYTLSVDSHGIRHVLLQHGAVETEVMRGQLPISKEDWGHLPVIVALADAIADSQKSRLGNNCVLFEKEIGAKRYFSIWEIRTITSIRKQARKKSRLMLQTFYARRPKASR